MNDFTEGRAGPRGPRTLPFLTSLPPELLLCITDYLKALDRVSLALTCRSLYNVLHRRDLLKLNRSDKMKFLKGLEKELESQYLCLKCEKLHLIHLWKADNFGWSERDLQRMECVASSQIKTPFNYGSHFAFNHARMALNGRLWEGGKDEIPPGLLETDMTWLFDSGIKVTLMRQVRTYSEQLYFRTKCTISHHEGVDALLSALSATVEIHRICNHVSISSTSWPETKVCKPNDHFMDPGPLLPLLFAKHPTSEVPRGVTTGCLFCALDFSLQISTSPEDAPTIEFDIYQNLGGCHELKDWRWENNLIEMSGIRRTRRWNRSVGDIMSRWKKEEGVQPLGWHTSTGTQEVKDIWLETLRKQNMRSYQDW